MSWSPALRLAHKRVLLARARDCAARYRAGETLNEIGVSFGCTRERVRQLIKLVGVTGAKLGRGVRDVDNPAALAKAIELYRSGLPCQVAARRARATHDTVRRHLKALGIYEPRWTWDGRPRVGHGASRYKLGCRCWRCRRGNTAEQLKWQRNNRAKGNCYRCITPASPGHTLCDRHLADRRVA